MRIKSLKNYILLFALLVSAKAFAQNFKNEFGFRSENDAYLAMGQDRYYTNGLFITFRHATRPNFHSTDIVKKTWEAEFGQYMYNAVSGSVRDISDVDRPFAAYLYGGAKINWFKRNESNFQAGFQIGTIGPNSKGREVQEALHKIVGFYTINGWQYQVNNEVGVNASFNFDKLLFRKNNNDFILNTSANLGNTFSGLGVGITYRTGALNPIFSSITTNSRITNNQSDTVKRESFFYARPSLKFVGYNATLQGGLFQKDKGPVVYTPNRLVFSQEFGLMYAKNRWSLNFGVIFQTKELKEQIKSSQYGTASIFYRFN